MALPLIMQKVLGANVGLKLCSEDGMKKSLLKNN